MERKRSKKEIREENILMGLVELYLEHGKPVGSNTLKENGFESMSSATIRNYFADLEQHGYVKQPHSSGGRIPTNLAFRLYAEKIMPESKAVNNPELECVLKQETKHLHPYLHTAAEKLSEVSGYATFLSSLRFDHDFIREIKLVSIDKARLLCVLITDFGQILTEELPAPKKLSGFMTKRLENFLSWRMRGGEKPPKLHKSEEELALSIYHEIMVRYLVRYSNFSEEEVYRTGFSRLLNFPEFNDPIALSQGLSLFENMQQMRQLLADCARQDEIKVWVGEDLAAYGSKGSACSIIAIPYKIGQSQAGAVGILGPARMPYKQLFGQVRYFAQELSQTLSKTLCKYQLSFRQPRATHPYVINDQNSYKMLTMKENT